MLTVREWSMFPGLDKHEEQKWIGQFQREMQTVTWHFETNAKCWCWSGVPGDTELGLVLSEERVNERRREIEVNRERVRENMRERHAVGWYSWESLQLLQYLELSWGQIPHGNERKPAEVERAFWRNVSLQMENVCSCLPSFNVVYIWYPLWFWTNRLFCWHLDFLGHHGLGCHVEYENH